MTRLIPAWSNLLVAAIATALLALTAAPVGATVPEAISFQGLLLDDQGTPVQGPVDFGFALFAASSGGTAMWTESHAGVAVLDGVYDVKLGSQTPIPGDVLQTGTLWLEVTVSGQTLTPRKQILTVPYALRARTAETLATQGTSQIGFVQIGNLQGSETQAPYQDFSPVRSFRWSVELPNFGNGNVGPGMLPNPARGPLVVSIDDERLVPELSFHGASGTVFSQGVVAIGPPGTSPDHQLLLDEVAVQTVERITPTDADEPLQSGVTLVFRRVRLSSGGGNEYDYDFESLQTNGSFCAANFDFALLAGSNVDLGRVNPNAIQASALELPSVMNSVEPTGGGGGAGNPSLDVLRATVPYDSPCLVSHALQRTIFADVVFEVWTAASDIEPESIVTLEGAAISKLEIENVGAALQQTVSWAYNKIIWSNRNGSEWHWDRATATGGMGTGSP